MDLSLTIETRLDVPHSCHGDDDPVEGGGDVREARVLSLLYVVSQAGEGETRDNQNQDLTRGQGLAREKIRDKRSYQKSEFPSALAECEDDGLQSTRMPEINYLVELRLT